MSVVRPIAVALGLIAAIAVVSAQTPKSATPAKAQAPAAVITAFKARYPKAAVTRYEKLTKGTAIWYEMAVTGAGAVKEVELAPDGTFINPKPVKK